MCFAKPGPRCYGHATTKLENTEAKLAKTEETIKEISEESQRIAKKHPKNYQSRYDYKELQKRNAKETGKLSYLRRVAREDTLDADATIGGIEYLEKRTQELNPGLESDEKEYDELSVRLHEAKNTFRKKLLNYDYEKGTVNGRNPSPYGSDKGIIILHAKHKELQTKAEASTGEKKEKYEARAAAVKEQIIHAKETRSHAQEGITDYPSANLAGNKVKLKEAQAELDKANKAYTTEQDAYTSGPVQEMKDLIAKQKEAGLLSRSKWSAKDKRTYTNLETKAEAMWDEKVKPLTYRVRQFEGITSKLENQIKLGSISAKERAANKQRSRYGAY